MKKEKFICKSLSFWYARALFSCIIGAVWGHAIDDPKIFVVNEGMLKQWLQQWY